jgi:DNA-binding HxlR family transcriptional regulator
MAREYQKPFLCSVEAVLAVIGGRWKAVIIFHLILQKVLRFGELKKLIPKVTQRMLTNQLRELEEDGIINRKVYAEVPPRVEYSLTKYGQTLAPLMYALRDWGDEHLRKLGVKPPCSDN